MNNTNNIFSVNLTTEQFEMVNSIKAVIVEKYDENIEELTDSLILDYTLEMILSM